MQNFNLSHFFSTQKQMTSKKTAPIEAASTSVPKPPQSLKIKCHSKDTGSENERHYYAPLRAALREFGIPESYLKNPTPFSIISQFIKTPFSDETHQSLLAIQAYLKKTTHKDKNKALIINFLLSLQTKKNTDGQKERSDALSKSLSSHPQLPLEDTLTLYGENPFYSPKVTAPTYATGPSHPRSIGQITAAKLDALKEEAAQPNIALTIRSGQFGTAFRGNTAITCWLEAFIYSTAYEKGGATLGLLRENSARLQRAEAGSQLATWKLANKARAEALIMLSAFLDSVASEPTKTLDITQLDLTLQRAFFREAWRQQDAMQFRESLIATLSEIMKADKKRDLDTPFSMTRNSSTVSYRAVGADFQTTENRFMAHEAVEFRINLYKEAAHLGEGDLSTYLVHQDEAGTVADYALPNGSKVPITKGARVFVGTAPQTCQIQVMSAVNDYTHAPPKAHTLTPTGADTDAPFITLRIKASAAADDAAVETRYLIEQAVVHSGTGNSGHYKCYFKEARSGHWYLKTRNGNPATRVKKTDGSDGGFPDVLAELQSGGFTYTYMGVKA